MENCITSKPLYERIIFDRQQNRVQGFTFENTSDSVYQETYSFQQDPSDANNTLYHAYLFKSPGMRRWIRYKAHAWGVDKMNSIIEKDLKDDVKNKIKVTKEKAIHMKETAKENLKESKEKLKQKLKFEGKQ